ncbi:TAXI family TRAP transporter solute-binding subunit [Ectothiorhodospiraceae bacterium WFHF3C12]|nr:TAXI family TRAP transporter solute-binding subunit [Ectothiorhodospiraceae bacterium WFHF3C12]
MMRKTLISLAASALVGVTSLGATAQAQVEGVDLPDTLAMTAYGTGSSGYTQMAAVGNMLQQRYGTSVRILPGENDVSRMTPLKSGRVDLCACGIASYYGSEGVFLFADPDWGPQKIRVVITSIGSFGLGVAVAGDIGVKTPADLKGKRVAYVRGAPALNVGTESYLAYGGLTWDDVERVTFPGYGRAFEGIIGDQADAAFTMSVAPPAKQLAASPRGIVWPTLDPNNKEGWKRLNEKAPYFQPHTVTSAAGDQYGKDNPWQGSSYPYPILVANAGTQPEMVYDLLKVMIEDHDAYKDSAPGTDGYALENQNMQWVVPFHESAVKYYKEIGHWTEDMQAHQDMLVRRQEVLAQAWEEFMASNPPAKDDGFAEAWMEARAEALEAEGMNPVFR